MHNKYVVTRKGEGRDCPSGRAKRASSPGGREGNPPFYRKLINPWQFSLGEAEDAGQLSLLFGFASRKHPLRINCLPTAFKCPRREDSINFFDACDRLDRDVSRVAIRVCFQLVSFAAILFYKRFNSISSLSLFLLFLRSPFFIFDDPRRSEKINARILFSLSNFVTERKRKWYFSLGENAWSNFFNTYVEKFQALFSLLIQFWKYCPSIVLSIPVYQFRYPSVSINKSAS